MLSLIRYKRDEIEQDIKAVNDRMKELEKEHELRIVQQHELRGAQRAVASLLQQAIEMEPKDAPSPSQPSIAHVEATFKVGDRVIHGETTAMGAVESINLDLPYPYYVQFDNGEFNTYCDQEIKLVPLECSDCLISNFSDTIVGSATGIGEAKADSADRIVSSGSADWEGKGYV